ncbi:MAG: MFS transporter [Planctomycetota bacterium]
MMSDEPPPCPRPSVAERVHAALGLDSSVAWVGAAMFVMGLGEELWRRFVGKYLQVLGAPIAAIGAFGTVSALLDGIAQYPGGWLADRHGRRRALRAFVLVAGAGYVIAALAWSWPIVFLALPFIMAWSSLASPAMFAVVGDALPRGKRAAGFTVQAILKRLPVLIAPALGGALITAHGTATGIRIGLAASVLLAAVASVLVARVGAAAHGAATVTSVAGVWQSLPRALRAVLAADILIRTCEAMVDVLIVVYVTDQLGCSAATYGVLVAIQVATSIAVYVPAARGADRLGRRPFVIATCVCFALFPVMIAMASGARSLVLAFVIGGLREIGEPARKAMIVDFAAPHLRARSVGLYYLIRCLAIAPAGAIGGCLWRLAPQVPFFVAGATGIAGVVQFALTVREP